MFEDTETNISVRKTPKSTAVVDSRPAVRKPAVNDYDSAQSRILHNRLISYYQQELERQSDNRAEMHEDDGFYDNQQWRDADKAILEERGQMPLVYNVISSSIDWITGTEKRGRTDSKVLPRRKEDGKSAERKTQILKYLNDVNATGFCVSRAFEDSTKVGIGWLEDGIQDADENEPIYTRYESWRNMLWDSTANELDLSDARYVARVKWVDLDIALAMFPERAECLMASAQAMSYGLGITSLGDDAMDSAEDVGGMSAATAQVSGLSGGYTRQRVRLVEMWYRQPIKAHRMKGGTFSGEFFDQYSAAHADELEQGLADTVEKMTPRMHVGIFTESHMIFNSQSPYRHNQFPFTPVWGHRRSKDGLPYGMVRRTKSIQEDVNKRASKALHILSTNKTIMDEGALANDMTIDEYLEEVARPDAVITVTPGKRLDINVDRELSQYHLNLMQQGISLIQSASGITDENLGRRTNASSGIAIQRRQDQGALATTKYFDNLLYAQQKRGEKQLSLIEQFMTEEKQFRITNKSGKPEYVKVNDGLPENDITRSKADFVISDTEYRASMRQAASEQLLEVAGRMPPQVMMSMLDLIIENMDLPNSEELVRRIRQLTGMQDPDLDEQSPEYAAAKQAEQGQANAMAQLQQTEMAERAARIDKIIAETEAKRADTTLKAVNAQDAALDAALKALAAPQAADAADYILDETGFTGTTKKTAARAQLAAQAQQAAEQQPIAEMAAPLAQPALTAPTQPEPIQAAMEPA